MSDLISRQAVINAIANTCFWLSADNWEELTKCINSIPSVENKGEPKECARILKKHCINTKDCKECFMWDECKYELLSPGNWDLPESEEEGEE